MDSLLALSVYQLTIAGSGGSNILHLLCHTHAPTNVLIVLSFCTYLFSIFCAVISSIEQGGGWYTNMQWGTFLAFIKIYLYSTLSCSTCKVNQFTSKYKIKHSPTLILTMETKCLKLWQNDSVNTYLSMTWHLQPVYTSVSDRAGSIQFELSCSVKADQVEPNSAEPL